MDRLELQTKLEEVAPNVYFQPPSSIQMQYPAVVYKLDDLDAKHADNLPYIVTQKFLVTVIDKDPNSVIANNLSKWKSSKLVRSYTSENIYHYVFTIF